MRRWTVVLLIIVLLGGGALAGWYFWDKNKKTESPGANFDPSEQGKYLVIREWHVRFLLPDDLRGDIYYKIDKGKAAYVPDTPSDRAHFGAHSLDNIPGSSCKLEFSDSIVLGGIRLALYRMKTPLPTTDGYIYGNKLLNDQYYYSLLYGHNSCGAGQKQTDIIQELIGPIKSIELYK